MAPVSFQCKAYVVDEEGYNVSKTSSKRSIKSRNPFGKEHFLSVLETTKPHTVKMGDLSETIYH